MAVKLGVDRLGYWADRMGFGKRTRIRLPDEAAGIVASTKWAQCQGRPGVFTGELAQAGIGQNVIAVTPLQLPERLRRPRERWSPDAADDRARRGGRQPAAGQGVRAGPLGQRRASHANLRRCGWVRGRSSPAGHAYNIRDLPSRARSPGRRGRRSSAPRRSDGSAAVPLVVRCLPADAGPARPTRTSTVITFSYSAIGAGQRVDSRSSSTSSSKYYHLDQDLRLDPRNFSLVAAN